MTSQVASNRRLPVVLALVTANAIMAISQANIASIYLPISTDFHQSLYGLGLLTSIYFAGYGLFEIPAAVVAARVGPKLLVLSGGLLTSVALLASAFSPSFTLLVGLRAITGIGYGFLFPPAFVLITRNVGRGSVGFGAALSTISFSIGATVGIFGWSVLSAASGWRFSILLESAFTFAGIAAVAVVVPRDELAREFRVTASGLKRTFTDRSLLAVGVAILGLGATANLTGSFLVYYLEEAFGMGPGLAGLVGATAFITPLFTGIVAGRLYDRGVDTKALLGVSGVTLLLGTVAVALHSPYAALLGSIVAGLGIGVGGTTAFSAARDLAQSAEYESLSVSVVDGASLLGLFVSPIYFSLIAVQSGYPLAWVVGSLSAVVLLAPLLLTKLRGRRTRSDVTSLATG